MDDPEARVKIGERVQRCHGCYVAFYMKTMWLGEGGLLYCSECKDDSMFHFDDFIAKLEAARAGTRDEEKEGPE